MCVIVEHASFPFNSITPKGHELGENSSVKILLDSSTDCEYPRNVHTGEAGGN